MRTKSALRGQVIILGLCLLVIAAAGAQAPGSEWRVWVYDQGQGLLMSVGPGGMDRTITLPQDLIRPVEDFTPRPAAISPDGRYIILYTDYAALSIVDLAAQPCCQPLVQPLSTLEGYIAGEFSPDGSQFAAAFVGADGSGGIFQGGIVVIDVAANRIAGSVSAALFGPNGAATASDVSWQKDGIYFLPNCWGCEPAFEGRLYRWTPPNGPVTESGLYYSALGDQLALTGETVARIMDARFPGISDPEAVFIPPSNVVNYYPGNLLTISFADGQPVFFDAQDLDLPRPAWVLDGQAFLVHHSGAASGTLVYRAEPQTILAFPEGMEFVAGTPDGWLMQIRSGTATLLYHYTRDAAGGYGARLVSQFVGPLLLVQGTGLGASAQGAFPVIPAPEVTTCPGFMPSRLQIGGRGRVLPGDANNLRANPSSSSALVGQMPGGGEFSVIDGPQCDPLGIAWWQVNYLGTVGWTGEGQGNEYWVEPIR